MEKLHLAIAAVIIVIIIILVWWWQRESFSEPKSAQGLTEFMDLIGLDQYTKQDPNANGANAETHKYFDIYVGKRDGRDVLIMKQKNDDLTSDKLQKQMNRFPDMKWKTMYNNVTYFKILHDNGPDSDFFILHRA